MSYFSFRETLEAAGWTKLGAGINACVYGKDGCDQVVKVGCNPDDAWLDYVVHGSDHGMAANPHFPKVFSLKVYKGWYVAVLERLTCTAGQLDWDAAKHGLSYAQVDEMKQAQRKISEGVYGVPPRPAAADSLSKMAKFLRDNFNEFDLHGGNYMVRTTPQGPQLVVIDPVYQAVGKAATYRKAQRRQQASQRKAA